MPKTGSPGIGKDAWRSDGILHRESDRFEDRDVAGMAAALNRTGQQLAEIAGDVVVAQFTQGDGDHDVARFGLGCRVMVYEDPGCGDELGVELAHGLGIGAHGVDVRALLDPVAVEDWFGGVGGRTDDVGRFNAHAYVIAGRCADVKLGLQMDAERGVFFAVNWQESKILWEYESPERSGAFRSSAAVLPEAVIVGSRDKLLHALDPKSGQTLWTFPTRGQIDSSPVVVEDRVLVGSTDGRLYAVDRRTGKQLWQFEAGGRLVASPAVAARRLVIGNDEGDLYCFGTK